MIYTMDWFFSSTFTEIIKTLLSIDSIIYWLIAQFFRFIIDISSADFIMTDLLNTIIDRAYVVAGVFALFIMSYALIKGLFDPDGVFKGKNSLGQIIKNLLIAIALVALMPTIFTYLFRFQAIIINNNVIGNIVLGTDSQAMKFKVDGKYQEISVENVGYENYIKVASNNVAFSALNAFIYADDNDKKIDLSEKPTVGMFLTPSTTLTFGLSGSAKVLESVVREISGNNETTFNQLKNNIVISGNFLEINTIAYHVATGGDYSNEEGAHVTYLFIVSTICGIVMLFLVFTFCINIVVRMFNLFLLELISPIASFSLVIPNSKIFDNWFKATMKEYLDLFVRLFTFNLAILFFSNINQIIVQVIEGHGNIGLISIMNILFVIGLLIFINEAPKLVKDILGMKDDKKGIKDRLFSGGVSKTLGGALGLLGGGAAAGMGIAHALGSGSGDVSGGRKAWNAIKGAASGFGAGKNASKAKSFSDFTGAVGKSVSAMDTNRKKGDLYYKQHGGTFKSAMLGRLEDAKNYVTGASPMLAFETYNEQENKLRDIKKNMDNINDIAEKNSQVKALKSKRDKFENDIKGRASFEDQFKLDTANEIADLQNDFNRKRELYDKYEQSLTTDKQELARLTDEYNKTPANQMFTKQDLQNKINSLNTSISAKTAQRDAALSDVNDVESRINAAKDRVKDKEFIDLAYSNYLVDAQNELNKLDVEFKTARSNYINSQAKVNGSEIKLEVEKINRDLVKEANAKNVFMEGVELTPDISAINQIDKYLDDVKDSIFGKSSIYNDKEQTVGINYSTGDIDFAELANLRATYQDAMPNIVIGERQAKVWDSTSNQYVIEDAGIGTLIKNIAETTVSNFKDLSSAEKEIKLREIRNDCNQNGEIKGIVDAIRQGFNDVATGTKADMSDVTATINSFISSKGLDTKGVTADELTKAIIKMNSGIQRGASESKDYSVGRIHKSDDYLNARQKAEEAYAKEKENK